MMSNKTPPSFLAGIGNIISSWIDGLLGDDEEPKKGSRRAPANFVARYPLIPQEDESGCGVACIAMIALRSYDDVKATLFKSKRKRVFYTNYKDLRGGLERYGRSLESVRARAFTGFSAIDATSVVAVELSPASKSRWHWVVFVVDGRRRYVLDPSWPGIVRTDLRGLRGRHFLRVVEPERQLQRAKVRKSRAQR